MAHTNERYTVEQVAEALLKAGGVLTWAGELLGCTGGTIRRYLDEYPELEEVRAEAREITIDIAEHKLIDKVKSGNLAATIFYLKCQGKQRGYVERGELTIANRQPVVLMLPPEDNAGELDGGNGGAPEVGTSARPLPALPPANGGERSARVAELVDAVSVRDIVARSRRPDGWHGGEDEPPGEDLRTPDEIDDDGGPY